jgi:hypothetical protein
VGPSGIGKSSLVFAGLLPALRRQRDTTVWDVVTLRPTALPLHALAQAFNPQPPEVGVFARQEWLSNEAPDKLAPIIAQCGRSRSTLRRAHRRTATANR